MQGYEVVLNAVSDGTITPDEASTIAGELEAKRRSIETCEHEARMTVLEKIKG